MSEPTKDEDQKEELFVLPNGAVLNPDSTVTCQLIFPIKYNHGSADASITEVTIRRKNAGDNLAIADMDNGIRVGFQLIMRLTGLTAKQAGLIDDADQLRIASIIEGFTMPGQLDGSGALE
jgi:hypothetical protein